MRPHHLEKSPPAATDGHVVQSLLPLLGLTEDPEEAGQAGLIVVPGEVEL